MKKLTLISLLLCFIFSLSAQNTDVLLQGFNWDSHSNTLGWYNVVKDKAADMDAAGIDMVWLPPPSDAAAVQGYLPRKLYDVNSEYGTQAELQSAISELHSYGIKAIADIVINHRVGVTNWADFDQPAWDCSAVVANDEWGQNGGNPCGNWDTGDNYHAARDIDHTNATVQADLIAWMNWLKTTIGFDGWRYDYVRGYSGYYNSVYNNATSPYFSVGELWDNLDLNNYDPHRQQLADWVNSTQVTSTVFDFTTKGVLQQAVNGELWRLSNNGNAPGLIGWWPAQSVTFVDNHDTGSSQNYWPFPGDKVMQGYAYILTHPGIPTVFWDHFYDWGLHDEIKALIQIRKDNGLHSESSIDIKAASWDLYAAEIDGKVAMKIGPGSWSPQGSDWVLTAFGNDYAVWVKSAPSCNGDMTVYFKKPTNWSTATIYYWNVTPGGAATGWPGAGMTDMGNGWYSYTLPCADCANIIFSDNGANQTADLYRCGDGWYNGSWHNSNPDSGGGNSLTVHFRPSGFSNPTIYYWNVTPSGATTSWPGVPMISEGNGWYYYTFANTDCANFIFSNNGASQTADLYSCSEYWYENGVGWNSEASDNATFAPEIEVQHAPNPARDHMDITVRLTAPAEVQLELFDLSGRPVMMTQQFESSEGQLVLPVDVSQLSSGVYWYRLHAGAQTVTKKFVVTK